MKQNVQNGTTTSNEMRRGKRHHEAASNSCNSVYKSILVTSLVLIYRGEHQLLLLFSGRQSFHFIQVWIFTVLRPGTSLCILVLRFKQV